MPCFQGFNRLLTERNPHKPRHSAPSRTGVRDHAPINTCFVEKLTVNCFC
uniref:Uncharacterized protein n=1 Tax=Anguilla anguilla TaxID=7936 RepID=A0A0E9W2C3_ANGAN